MSATRISGTQISNAVCVWYGVIIMKPACGADQALENRKAGLADATNNPPPVPQTAIGERQ